MEPKILDGKQISASLRKQIHSCATQMSDSPPGLATVLVGEDPASLSYVRGKQKACEQTGITGIDVRLDRTVSRENLLEQIEQLNERSDVHGILVQQPLPDHLDAEEIVAAVDPAKDVDGFHPTNLGLMLRGRPCMLPPTPFGVVKVFEQTGIDVQGKTVCVVGRSLLVGRPLAAMLMLKGASGNATVTVCHSRTADIATHTRKADIVVVAIGKAGYLTPDMVSDGVVVIDVGINRVDDASRKRGYRLVGDVDYASVAPKTSAITPVPGGVGPMTVTMLLYNTLQAARGRFSQDPL